MSENLHNIQPFQVFDILSKEDFEKVLIEKFNYYNPKTANGDYIQCGVTVKLNLRYSEEKIGIFSKVCDRIKEELLLKGLLEPRITELDFLNQVNRPNMAFHKHWLLPMISPYDPYTPPTNSKSPYAVPFEYFWIAIYYTHNLYDEKNHGELTVRLNKDSEGQTFKAVPNSLVLHNGLYGHEVSIKELHPTILRDSCFTHWVCKYR